MLYQNAQDREGSRFKSARRQQPQIRLGTATTKRKAQSNQLIQQPNNQGRTQMKKEKNNEYLDQWS